jgi:hypothetical protein
VETRNNNEENDTVIAVPSVVQSVGVTVPLVTVPVEIRNVPVAVAIPKRCRESHLYYLSHSKSIRPVAMKFSFSAS